MKKTILGMVAVLLLSVFVLSGCSTSFQDLGTTFNLDLENKKVQLKLDAGLLGLESISGDNSATGDILLDIQLDWKNKNVQLKVDTESSEKQDGHLVFVLNWEKRDVYFMLDSEYPSTEEEKAKGAPDINSVYFDILLDWQNRKLGTNLNVGPFNLHVPVSEESNNEGENVK